MPFAVLAPAACLSFLIMARRRARSSFAGLLVILAALVAGCVVTRESGAVTREPDAVSRELAYGAVDHAHAQPGGQAIAVEDADERSQALAHADAAGVETEPAVAAFGRDTGVERGYVLRCADAAVPVGGGVPPGLPELGIVKDRCGCAFPATTTDTARFGAFASVVIAPTGGHFWPTPGSASWPFDPERDLWGYVSRVHL